MVVQFVGDSMPAPHKVFKFESDELTFVLIPQGNASSFRYKDIHVESNAVLRLLNSPDIEKLIVDLSAVSNVSSVIIGAIIRMAQSVSQRGGKVALCSASDNIDEVIRTMNLTKLWPLCETREEAIAILEK